MSRSDPQDSGVQLVVRADPATEIFVIDHTFSLRARGVGQVRETLDPGAYKIKYRRGSRVQEEHHILRSGQGPVIVEAPRLEFSSAAPLVTTRMTHEYHMDAAAQLSRGVQHGVGTGSELFVFIRAWTERGAAPMPGSDPAVGLTLHDAAGHLLVDFAAAGQRDLTVPDPWAGCTVRLNPGNYRLRARTPSWGTLEQMVAASPGWQTQIFLLQGRDEENPVGPPWPDLSNAAILMARPGQGFDPHREDFRLAEAARIALSNRRGYLARYHLDQMLWAKFENPMLGIYGAHALLSALSDRAEKGERVRGSDRQLLQTVVENLRGLVGSHPDVAALALRVGPGAPAVTFADPPMLRSSWAIVSNAAADQPQLVPADSLAARIPPYVLGPGPWLIWLADPLEAEPREAPAVGLEEGLARLAAIATEVTDEEGLPRTRMELNGLEAAVLSYAARGGRRRRRPPVAPAAAPAAPQAPEATPAQTLARSLGVPPASLHAAVGGLLKKLPRPLAQ